MLIPRTWPALARPGLSIASAACPARVVSGGVGQERPVGEVGRVRLRCDPPRGGESRSPARRPAGLDEAVDVGPVNLAGSNAQQGLSIAGTTITHPTSSPGCEVETAAGNAFDEESPVEVVDVVAGQSLSPADVAAEEPAPGPGRLERPAGAQKRSYRAGPAAPGNPPRRHPGPKQRWWPVSNKALKLPSRPFHRWNGLGGLNLVVVDGPDVRRGASKIFPSVQILCRFSAQIFPGSCRWPPPEATVSLEDAACALPARSLRPIR